MSTSALVVGEALIDIVRSPDGTVAEHVGGSPLNVAIGLARLGHRTELATWIGSDERGTAIAQHLAADEVPLTPGSTGATRTPTAEATLDSSGAASYRFDIDWQVGELPLTDGTHLHTGSIASVLQPGASTVREACFDQRMKGTISFDPNCRPQIMGTAADVRSDIEQLVGLADVVKASDEDVAWLYGREADLTQVAALWAQLGPSLVVITRGGDGALAYLSSVNEAKTVAGQPTSVIDTVGAGDSFMAGLISGLLDADLLGATSAREALRTAGWADVQPSLDRAIAASAITVSRAGAQPPTRAELTSG